MGAAQHVQHRPVAENRNEHQHVGRGVGDGVREASDGGGKQFRRHCPRNRQQAEHGEGDKHQEARNGHPVVFRRTLFNPEREKARYEHANGHSSGRDHDQGTPLVPLEEICVKNGHEEADGADENGSGVGVHTGADFLGKG